MMCFSVSGTSGRLRVKRATDQLFAQVDNPASLENIETKWVDEILEVSLIPSRTGQSILILSLVLPRSKGSSEAHSVSSKVLTMVLCPT